MYGTCLYQHSVASQEPQDVTRIYLPADLVKKPNQCVNTDTFDKGDLVVRISYYDFIECSEGGIRK